LSTALTLAEAGGSWCADERFALLDVTLDHVPCELGIVSEQLHVVIQFDLDVVELDEDGWQSDETEEDGDPGKTHRSVGGKMSPRHC
jgi:hypothetical protein